MNKTFLCAICQNNRFAHEFVEQINDWYGLREFRLLCKYCIPLFAVWKNQEQVLYLQQRLEKHYGEDQYIYALCQPATDELRYIGKTNNPRQRFTRHLAGLRELTKEICPFSEKIKLGCDCSVHSTRNLKNSSRYWIAHLTMKNLKPTMRILEKVTPAVRVAEREIRWITYSIQNKNRLLNAENQSPALRKIVRQEKESFLDIPLGKLVTRGFTFKYRSLLFGVQKFSGWNYAEFIHSTYNNLTIEAIT